ncbi:MAG: hypothetical protein IJ731_06130 [Eubacterium sp.]|nr:hypothetical protein [Eubacterium sp.]
MAEKQKQAIEKVDGEAEKLSSIAVIICEHIISKINSDENADKVLDEKKSLSDCINKIKAKAKDRAKNNMAMIEDAEVYSWVDEYYGFNQVQSSKIVDILDFV